MTARFMGKNVLAGKALKLGENVNPFVTTFCDVILPLRAIFFGLFQSHRPSTQKSMKMLIDSDLTFTVRAAYQTECDVLFHINLSCTCHKYKRKTAFYGHLKKQQQNYGFNVVLPVGLGILGA